MSKDALIKLNRAAISQLLEDLANEIISLKARVEILERCLPEENENGETDNDDGSRDAYE